jgi:hypothetical protein
MSTASLQSNAAGRNGGRGPTGRSGENFSAEYVGYDHPVAVVLDLMQPVGTLVARRGDESKDLLAKHSVDSNPDLQATPSTMRMSGSDF